MATQGNKEGPVLTPMEWVPGEPSKHDATGGGSYNGLPGYPSGTPTTLPEIVFDNSGDFGKVPKAKE